MRKTILTITALALAFIFAHAADAQALYKRGKKDANDWYTMDEDKPRGWQKYDTILVRVNNSTNATREDRFEGRKEFTAEATLEDYIKIGKGLNLSAGDAGNLSLGLDTSLESRDEGRRRRRSQLTDSIMVEVTEVMPNYDAEKNIGRVQIRASKEVRVGDDVERVEISGSIDVSWIGADRTVSHDKIVDLKLHYYGNGDVSDSASMGWFAKLLMWAWPF